MRTVAAIAAFIIAASIGACAGDKPLQPYSTLIIRDFTVAPEVLKRGDFPSGYEEVLQKTLFARLLNDRAFPEVIEANGSRTARDAVVMEAQVTEFDKGNRAARVAVGYGAGSAKITLVLKFRDMATGRDVLTVERTGRYVGFGNLTGGSADTARNESARKLIDGIVKKIQAAR